MRILILSIISFVIIGITFAGVGVFAQQESATDSPEAIKKAIEEKAQKLKEINLKINETSQNLEQKKEEGTRIQKQVSNLGYNIKQLNLKVEAGEITVEKLRLELQELSYNIEGIENDIGSKKDGISVSLRTIQQNDNDGLLAILLRKGTLADSVTEAQNLIDLNINLAAELQNLKNLQQLLNEQLDQTSRKKSGIETETVNTKNRAELVNEQKKEQEQLLGLTKAQQKKYEAELSELEKQQDSISSEINDLEEALRRSFNTSVLPQKGTGVLAMPIANPRITQHYGEVSNLYRGRPHNGLDIGAPYGTEILAARDGVVRAVGNNGRLQYGKFVLIEHDNGLSTLYAHMSRQAATVGQTVISGQVIGYVGNTGYSFGNHLHLGLYWTSSLSMKSFPGAGLVPVGVTINPLDYM